MIRTVQTEHFSVIVGGGLDGVETSRSKERVGEIVARYYVRDRSPVVPKLSYVLVFKAVRLIIT
jgi:hypothetical protein